MDVAQITLCSIYKITRGAESRFDLLFREMSDFSVLLKEGSGMYLIIGDSLRVVCFYFQSKKIRKRLSALY